MDHAQSQNWDNALIDRLKGVAATVSVNDGTTIFSPGDDGDTFLIAMSGHIRVEQTGQSGRSIVLYRVGPGDSCVMTTSCMLSNIPYAAFGYAEGPVTALAIGRAVFERLLAEDAAFRSAVFAVFTHRLVELTCVIDDLLLNRMDQRLALWLTEKVDAPASISATHQQIATELGSAREVMSRILKDFERRGWVKTGRGAVDILDPAALARYAKSDVM